MIKKLVKYYLKKTGKITEELQQESESIENLKELTKEIQLKDQELKLRYDIIDAENDILKMISAGKNIDKIFNKIILIVEGFLENCYASILEHKDGILYNWYSPNLPKDYTKILDEGIPLSSENRYSKDQSYSYDIEDDPTCKMVPELKDVALENGINSRHSYPIIGSDDKLLGIIAIYETNGTDINLADQLLFWSSKIMTVIIERDQTYEKLIENEQQLKETNELFSSVLETQDDIIGRITSEGIVTYANLACSVFSGISQHDLIGLNYFDIGVVHPDDILTAKKQARNVFEKHSRTTAEYRTIDKDNNIRWFHWESNLVNGELQAVARDITERKQIEEQYLYQRNLQQLLGKLANSFINLSFNDIDLKLYDSLEQITTFVNADRGYIFYYNQEENICYNKYEFCQNGISSQKDNLQNLSIDDIINWYNKHKIGNSIFIKCVSEYWDDEIRRILEYQNIKSVLTVPIMNDGKCQGFVGFDYVKDYRDYLENEESLLFEYTSMITNIINRQKREFNNLTYESLLNNTEFLIWYMSDPKTHGTANRAFLEFFGFESTYELIDSKITDFMLDDQAQNIIEKNKLVFENQGAISSEDWITNKDDEQRLLLVDKYPVLYNNKVDHIICSGVDITEEHNTKMKLKEAEEKFRLLVDRSQVIIFVINFDGKITFLSPSIHELLGYSDHELIRFPFYSLVHNDDQVMVDDFLRKVVLDNFEDKYIECRLIHKDNSIKWHRIIVRPVFEENELIKFVGNSIDITDWKKSQYNLSFSENMKKTNLLEAIINASHGYLWYKDRNHRYKFCDNKFKKTFHKIDEKFDITGWNDIELIDKYRKENNAIHDFGELCTSTDDHSNNVTYQCRYIEGGYIDNKLFLLEIIKTPLYHTNDKYIGNIGFAWDRSEELDIVLGDIEKLKKINRIEILSDNEYPNTPFVYYIKPLTKFDKTYIQESLNESSDIITHRSFTV